MESVPVRLIALPLTIDSEKVMESPAVREVLTVRAGASENVTESVLVRVNPSVALARLSANVIESETARVLPFWFVTLSANVTESAAVRASLTVRAGDSLKLIESADVRGWAAAPLVRLSAKVMLSLAVRTNEAAPASQKSASP
jgi:hypothetical protein